VYDIFYHTQAHQHKTQNNHYKIHIPTLVNKKFTLIAFLLFKVPILMLLTCSDLNNSNYLNLCMSNILLVPHYRIIGMKPNY